jgi:CRISPR/Cas system-associated protein Csx1
LSRQFGNALSRIKFDQEISDWVVMALKESHKHEKKYHDEIIAKNQKEINKIQNRIDSMYIDKLDGKISQEFFDKKYEEWQIDTNLS